MKPMCITCAVVLTVLALGCQRESSHSVSVPPRDETAITVRIAADESLSIGGTNLSDLAFVSLVGELSHGHRDSGAPRVILDLHNSVSLARLEEVEELVRKAGGVRQLTPEQELEHLLFDVESLLEEVPMDYRVLEIQRERLMDYTNGFFFLSDPPRNVEELRRQKRILEEYRTLQEWRYAPCLQALAEFVHQDNLKFKREFMANTTLPEPDVDAIIAAVEATDRMVDKRILSIKVPDQSNVEVTTGFIKGPLYGGGDILHLRKQDDGWKIVKKSSWVS